MLENASEASDDLAKLLPSLHNKLGDCSRDLDYHFDLKIQGLVVFGDEDEMRSAVLTGYKILGDGNQTRSSVALFTLCAQR